MKRSRIWDEVRRVIEDGQIPLIKLPREAEIRPMKYSRGRPRIRPYNGDKLVQERAFEHYAGSTTQPNRRPRCKARGCRNMLRRDDLLVCSEWCRSAVIKEARAMLLALGDMNHEDA